MIKKEFKSSDYNLIKFKAYHDMDIKMVKKDIINYKFAIVKGYMFIPFQLIVLYALPLQQHRQRNHLLQKFLQDPCLKVHHPQLT